MSDDGAPGLIRRYWHLVLLTLILFAATWVFADRYRAALRDHAVASQRAEALLQNRASLRLLESELQKFRLLPIVLSEYPDLRTAVRSGTRNAMLDDKLASLAAKTGAAAIFALDRRGLTISASNARLPNSFIGQDYSFRPYYRLAWAEGGGEYFALGTVSRRPGLYLSRRIDDAQGPIGVVVVKVEFDAIERAWADRTALTFVADGNGVILLSSDPAAKFRTIRPISPATKALIQKALQFGSAPLTPIGLQIGRDGLTRMPDGALAYAAGQPVPVGGWRLYHIEPLAPGLRMADQRAQLAAILFAGAMLLIGLLIGWLMVRRRRAVHARAELEREVSLRTAELAHEMEERIAADQRYRQAREELAHANRLGTLGTISAGIAHEINQPVATIRTFAENAAAFLERAQPQHAATNLREIVAMTDRIGSITGELRRFARRGVGHIGRVPLTDVFAGVQLLVSDRFRTAKVRLNLPAVPPDLAVKAGRVRLEQVIVNLLHNALDAVERTEAPWVAVTLQIQADQVVLDVEDSGTGIAPDVADRLFMPFASTKANGLGLGLHIALEIMTDFGGSLEYVAGSEHTLFRIRLERA